MSWDNRRIPRGSTRASRALRAATLTLWPTCYLNYPGCTHASTEDDHVIPVAEGGTDHPDNHRGACKHCHRIKSQAEATRGTKRHTTKRHQPPEPHPGLVTRHSPGGQVPHPTPRGSRHV